MPRSPLAGVARRASHVLSFHWHCSGTSAAVPGTKACSEGVGQQGKLGGWIAGTLAPHLALASPTSPRGTPPALKGSDPMYALRVTITALWTDCFHCSPLPRESWRLHTFTSRSNGVITFSLTGDAAMHVFWSGRVGRGVPHWDPCHSATAPSLLAKATGGGGGIPVPKEALAGLHLGTLPMHKVKIKVWSQTITC